MTFPLTISNPSGFDAMDMTIDWLNENRQDLQSQLDEYGVILFRGFPIKTAEDFDRFSACFNYDSFTYEESLSNAVRINLTPRVFTANEAPPEVEIFLHHEMAQTPIYPSRIFFYCQTAAAEGGATPVCRSDLLYQSLRSQHPEWANQFETLGVKYTTHMPADNDLESGQGRSWRSTLSVDDRQAAETKLEQLDYSWEWHADGSLRVTTCALPAVRNLADGSQSFFNQVIAAYLGWQRKAGDVRPLITFGNDDEIPEATLEKLVELSTEHIVPLEWQDGDVALVDNFRVMHGRFPYSGNRQRQVLVCLAA